MLIILSPSKTLKLDCPQQYLASGLPTFRKETETLVELMRTKDTRAIIEMMKISDQLAETTFKSFKQFKKSFPGSNSFPAAFIFDGGVYAGLDSGSIPESSFVFLEERLRILSGLYGVLKPFDKVQPYRLEMGSRLKTTKGTNLYHFWGQLITDQINKELTKLGKDSFLLNLASDEYFQSLQSPKIMRPIVSAEFKEMRNGVLKFISYDAKKARGSMARYVIDNQIVSVQDLKAFDVDGYKYNVEGSTNNELLFTR